MRMHAKVLFVSYIYEQVIIVQTSEACMKHLSVGEISTGSFSSCLLEMKIIFTYMLFYGSMALMIVVMEGEIRFLEVRRKTGFWMSSNV